MVGTNTAIRDVIRRVVLLEAACIVCNGHISWSYVPNSVTFCY